MNHKQKINLISLGCSKNLVDSEYLLGSLKNLNVTLTHNENSYGADIVIINTCGFIQDAKEESLNIILQHAKAKKSEGISKLYVMGC